MKKILYLMAAAIVLAGCSNQKNLRKQAKPDPQKQLVEQVRAAEPHFSTAQAQKVKVTIDYQQRQISANGSINVVCDSMMVLSVQPLLGIELFRIEVGKQYITVVDKMNRRYAQLSYSTVQEMTGIGVEYEDVEALLLSRLFAAGRPDSTISTLQLNVSEDAANHVIAFTEAPVEYVFRADRQNLTLNESSLLHKPGGQGIQVRYLNWQTWVDTVFPQTVEVTVTTPKLSGKCTLGISKISFNGKADVRPADLRKYTKTTIMNLLR
ncbi:MAG: DUF4292 domain-containing protein [Paludibacteraceae bacterium]|nr:DUF4292 domain-containing protein [Paludibacteraceae bacterium]